MTKKVIISPRKAAIGSKKSPAKGRPIATNLNITGQRVTKAIQQNVGSVSSGGIR